jgi:hypothetical protein
MVTTDLIALKDDMNENFASLQSKIKDFKDQMDRSTKEWQCNFGLSASIPHHFSPSNC